MFRNYKKSMADKQSRAGVFILLVFAFFILGSQSVMAAQTTAASSNLDEGKVFQDCLLDGGKQTKLPNGGYECCVGKYCTSCTNGQCTTTCNYRKKGLSKPGPGCIISPTLLEHVDANPTASGIVAPTNPPTLPPGMPPGTPPTFPIPPHQPPTVPLVAPAASGQSVPATPGVLVPIPTVGATTNVARVSNASSLSKFNRCLARKGHKLTDVRTSNSTGEKCCYPKNEETKTTTCIKCIYIDGGGEAICTKNTFKSVIDTPKVGTQNLPTTNAPPKPLTRMEELERGKLNPGSTPLAPAPSTKPLEESPQGGYTPIGSPEVLHRMK